MPLDIPFAICMFWAATFLSNRRVLDLLSLVPACTPIYPPT